MNELEQEIYNGIIKKMDLDESELSNIQADTPIFSNDAGDGNSMNLDSVDALELVVMIYDKWKIDVPAEDMPKLRTIKKIADYVTEHGE